MLLNRERLKDFMKKYDVDALVLSYYPNVAYATDFECAWLYKNHKEYMLHPGASANSLQANAILPLDRDPILVASTTVTGFTQGIWVKNVRTIGNASADLSLKDSLKNIDDEMKRVRKIWQSDRKPNNAETIASVIKDLGLENAVLGIDIEGMPVETQTALRSMLPDASLKNCCELVRLIRMVKSDEEISRLGKAAEIAEKAAIESVNEMRPGMHIGEAAQVFNEKVAKGGAIFDHYFYSRSGLELCGYPDWKLERGHSLYLDFGCMYRMYFSDSGFTVMVGPIEESLLKTYDALRETMSDTLEKVRPGVRPSALAQTMQELLRKRGIGTNQGQGHGIGIEPRDYPIISENLQGTVSDGFVHVSVDIPLEKGMVINLEIPYFKFGVGSFHLERTVSVTDNGYSDLTIQDRGRPLKI